MMTCILPTFLDSLVATTVKHTTTSGSAMYTACKVTGVTLHLSEKKIGKNLTVIPAPNAMKRLRAKRNQGIIRTVTQPRTLWPSSWMSPAVPGSPLPSPNLRTDSDCWPRAFASSRNIEMKMHGTVQAQPM